MHLFTVAIQETRIRQRRIAAPDELTAERLIRRGLKRGDQIMSISRHVHIGDPDTGQAALDFLLTRDFLPLDGRDATVADWIGACMRDPSSMTRDRALSVAGLRVTPDRLSIGSAACIPTLMHWCDGTPWHGFNLTAALRGLPGSTFANMTYAGRRARSVQLPLNDALAA